MERTQNGIKKTSFLLRERKPDFFTCALGLEQQHKTRGGGGGGSQRTVPLHGVLPYLMILI